MSYQRRPTLTFTLTNKRRRAGYASQVR